MKTLRFLVIFLVLASGISYCCNLCASSIAPSPTDTFKQQLKTTPKVTTILETNLTNGVRITHLRFESLEGTTNGTVTRNEIFALVARPENSSGKLPGVLVLHGGGQEPQVEKVMGWAKLGFVAVAPELPGFMGTDHVRSLSRVKGLPMASQMFVAAPNCYASTLFDSVMSGLLAFNLLESQVGVNKDQLCITGISWGGYMTTMLSGLLGNRVKAAFSLYGCGFYLEDTVFKNDLLNLPPEQRADWMRQLDAGTHLKDARAAVFLCPAAMDYFFHPPSVIATYAALPKSKFLCFGPHQSHWIDLPGGTTSWDGPTYTEMEPVFFWSVFENKALPKLSFTDAKATFTVHDLPEAAKVWAYYSSNVQTNWPNRVWKKVEVTSLTSDTFQAVIPEDVKELDWYGVISFDLKVGGLTRPMSLTTTIRHE